MRDWSHDEANPTPYSPEVRELAVRMVFDHQREHASQWAAISSNAAKIGCSGGARQGPWAAEQVRVASGGETLRNWIRQSERDQGQRAGPSMDERERIKTLEREVRELRQANDS